MWIKIIIGCFLIGCIENYWDDKIKKDKYKKGRYRFLKGVEYLAAAILSFFLASYMGDFLYLYAAIFVISGIGSVLSSINPNLRDMYTMGLVVAFAIWAISLHYESHKIIFTVVDIFLVFSFIGTVGEGIANIRDGIDPDVEEENKKNEKKWGKKLKRIKWFIKFWRWMG